ncbi:MAG: GntP family permease [Beijerinckiaceae bacterium]|nr:GntP family permease [Beijerinckiaceae bacterium]MCZ8300103.1 GntP family permease [Beijerinckiaceae bacterium]
MDDAKFLLLFALVGFTAFLSYRYRVVPFVALVLSTCLFCLVLRVDLTWVARSFHNGFGQSLAAGGLTILAGILVAWIGAATGALARLRAHLPERWRHRLLWLVALPAGIGGTPLAALAVLQPLVALVEAGRARAALGAAGIVNALQGALLPAPLPIAAMAVLQADWRLVLAYGAPVAVAQALFGLWLTRRAPAIPQEGLPVAQAGPRRAVIGLALAILCLLAMIIFNALGQIPSEPLGSGNTREQMIRLGLPLMLLVVGLGFALLPAGPSAIREALVGEGTVARAITASAGLLLAIGAAGGLQLVLHQDGFASLAVEAVAEGPAQLGLALPFLVALVSRVLQGSALTAAITAAGVMIPLLAPLGLDDPAGRALVVLAVTTGAIGAPHIQDGYFWLACHQAGLRADQGLRWVTLTALLQAALGLCLLLVLQRMVA